MNTKVDLKMHPPGRQLQHRKNHAIDARIAAPTKKIGYFNQSGTEVVPSAVTLITRSANVSKEKERDILRLGRNFAFRGEK
jgi:hypothetical protein